MLLNFLIENKTEILSLCESKLTAIDEGKSLSVEMTRGLPIFYGELIEVLRLEENGEPEQNKLITQSIHRDSAIIRGKESLRLGYTVSQVFMDTVHFVKALQSLRQVKITKI